MTVPAVSTSRETSTIPAPFSYAQAAKSKPTSSKVEASNQSEKLVTNGSEQVSATAAESLPEVMNGSWAEDAADAATVVEEQAQSGAKVDEGNDASKSDTAVAGLVNGGSSHDSVAEADASVSSSTANQDDAPSPSTPNTDELEWRRRPAPKEQAANGRKTNGSRRQKSRDASEPEQPPPAPLVEAPPPTVNFWTQRAQEAKGKQGPNSTPSNPQQPKSSTSAATRPASHSNDTRSASHSNESVPSAHSPTTSGQQEKGSMPPPPHPREARGASMSRGGRSRNTFGAGSTPASRRNSLHQASTTNKSNFPSLQDSLSWPTPETVHDDQRKKAPTKDAESREVEKSATSTSKPHGKNEWVHVPFTPSVKFETPIPTRAGRGARGGSRGGRDGIARGAPSSVMANSRGSPSIPSETSRAAPSRDRSGSNAHRSSLPNQNQNQNPMSETSIKENGSVPHQRSATTGEGTADEATAAVRVSPTNSASNVAQPATETPRGFHNKSTEGKTRRRNSRIAEPESSFPPRNGEHRRSGSLSSNAKSGWSDRRPEHASRLYDPNKDPYMTMPFRERGEGRPDRGHESRNRGGFHNGYMPSSIQIVNGQTYYPGGPHSAKSANFHGSFSNGSGHPRGGRGGGSGPRSASIPNDAQYGRLSSQYPASPQAFFGFGPYERGPATPTNAALPYMNMMLTNGVANQLNYYFSLDNLCKDVFLRQRMDSQGFVSLKFISEFSRMKSLTSDFELIKFVAQQNPELEVFPTQNQDLLVRRRDGWESFVLDMNQREPSAQHGGPTLPPPPDPSHFMPSPIRMNGYDHSHDFQSLQPTHHHQYPGFVPLPTGMPPEGRSKTSENTFAMSVKDSNVNFVPSSQSGQSPTPETATRPGDNEPDSYPDEKIPTELTILTRVRPDQLPQAHVSRSFSNGTIDGPVLVPQETSNEAGTQSPPQVNGSETSGQKAKFADIKEKLSPPPASNVSQSSRSAPPIVFWIKDSTEVVDPPPGSEAVPYVQICANAKQQRLNAEPGQCPTDMMLLYCFWSHFLLRNFNQKMFNDFTFFAEDDAKNGSRIGLERLLEYYDKALFSPERPIRRTVAQKYIESVRNEDSEGERACFKRLRGAWRNGEMNFKSRKVLQDFMDDDFKSALDR